jgi:hypothetical protein
MKKRLAWSFPAAVAGIVWLAPASAASLYFEKVIVKTASEKTCLGFANDVARRQGFKNLRRNSSEVAGEKGGAYVSITCVGRGSQPAVAVVMSVADRFDTAKAVGHPIAQGLKSIQNID